MSEFNENVVCFTFTAISLEKLKVEGTLIESTRSLDVGGFW